MSVLRFSRASTNFCSVIATAGSGANTSYLNVTSDSCFDLMYCNSARFTIGGLMTLSYYFDFFTCNFYEPAHIETDVEVTFRTPVRILCL